MARGCTFDVGDAARGITTVQSLVAPRLYTSERQHDSRALVYRFSSWMDMCVCVCANHAQIAGYGWCVDQSAALLKSIRV